MCCLVLVGTAFISCILATSCVFHSIRCRRLAAHLISLPRRRPTWPSLSTPTVRNIVYIVLIGPSLLRPKPSHKDQSSVGKCTLFPYLPSTKLYKAFTRSFSNFSLKAGAGISSPVSGENLGWGRKVFCARLSRVSGNWHSGRRASRDHNDRARRLWR